MARTLSLTVCALLCGAAHAEVTFEIIGAGVAATDVSNNGAVIVGNELANETFETFRWTQADGVVLLGRGTVVPLEVGAGTPNVSDDGSCVSATIITDDGTAAIAGVWENGVWSEAGFPLPADGGLVDSTYSSAWGISGDGSKVCGLYWRPGQPNGSGAHAMMADPSGTQSLSMSGMASSRANAINSDGTVAAGWQAQPTGYWFPAVWVNGVMTILDTDNAGAPAEGVSGDGNVVVGRYLNWTTMNREAARFVFDGVNWNREEIGALPGTPADLGHAWAMDTNYDGSIVVGINRFYDNGPFSLTTGFIWTEELGMVDIVDFLADNGVDFNTEQYEMISCEAISTDGTAIVGVIREVGTFNAYHSYLIRILPDCPWDLDGDGAVGSGDLALIIGFWGQTGIAADFNGDGVGSDDLAALIGNWGPCP